MRQPLRREVTRLRESSEFPQSGKTCEVLMCGLDTSLFEDRHISFLIRSLLLRLRQIYLPTNPGLLFPAWHITVEPFDCARYVWPSRWPRGIRITPSASPLLVDGAMLGPPAPFLAALQYHAYDETASSASRRTGSASRVLMPVDEARNNRVVFVMSFFDEIRRCLAQTK
jgi:hypothetical protein